ncbi:RND transporter [Acinetobacter sp. ANC 5054]|uniref:TolC family outer membrane protein n=1 Tax=Acinetobacter sp. ANC 5054 TaxID=1977877 RepID=UPI000A356FA4|nr:TolC family outer membrane protein [Acinetobacter sp. ANC 5054]OTG82696.1 RND transporter [Acinetobacter sp. ANC 5054]
MQLRNICGLVNGRVLINKSNIFCILLLPFSIGLVHAADTRTTQGTIQKTLDKIFLPNKPKPSAEKIDITSLSKFNLDTSRVQEMPAVSYGQTQTGRYNPNAVAKNISFIDAIHIALQRRPEITQSIASVASQNANIDIANAAYYPQVTGGLGTADLTKGERGRQLVSLNATQMLYDFGKTKSSVDIEEAKMLQEQANVLVNLDEVSYDVANAIINIKRYQEITNIAHQQIAGISRIAEIANLRATAGISSQADPIQAKSNLEAAESNLIAQETQLKQYQQRLRTLLGFDVSQVNWVIPDRILTAAELYQDPDFKMIPSMMQAQVGVEIAKLQKKQSKLSAYPTLNVVGSLSQAVNGRNPNNNEDDGMYSSIMLEAKSNLYQGGAVAAQTRAASFAEEAAKAQVNTVYLDVIDQVRMIREQIENKKRQMSVLVQRRETTVRTKELYQEQYKLGTRTVVDLLNAEQAIHSAAQEIVSSQYDIYAALAQYIQVTGRSRNIYELNNIAIQGFEVQP